MPTQSPMLNEIFASEKYIEPGQSKDVSHIVAKYPKTKRWCGMHGAKRIAN